MLFTPKALQKRCPQVLAMPFDLWSKLLQHLLHFITHDCAAVMLANTCNLRVMAPQIEILVNYCSRSITMYYIYSKQCTSPLQGHCIFYRQRQVCKEIVSSLSSGIDLVCATALAFHLAEVSSVFLTSIGNAVSLFCDSRAIRMAFHAADHDCKPLLKFKLQVLVTLKCPGFLYS